MALALAVDACFRLIRGCTEQAQRADLCSPSHDPPPFKTCRHSHHSYSPSEQHLAVIRYQGLDAPVSHALQSLSFSALRRHWCRRVGMYPFLGIAQAALDAFPVAHATYGGLSTINACCSHALYHLGCPLYYQMHVSGLGVYLAEQPGRSLGEAHQLSQITRILA